MKAFLNDVPVRFTEGETILEVARREGVFIPTLCEFAALHHRPGTCRMCLVEIVEKDRTRTVTACDTRMKEGLRVRTTGAQLRSMRKLQAELLFADHCERCSECPRHGDCELQTVAKTVGLDVSSLSGRFVNRHGTDATAPALTFTLHARQVHPLSSLPRSLPTGARRGRHHARRLRDRSGRRL